MTEKCVGYINHRWAATPSGVVSRHGMVKREWPNCWCERCGISAVDGWKFGRKFVERERESIRQQRAMNDLMVRNLKNVLS